VDEISRHLATKLTATWRAAADPELGGWVFFTRNTLSLLPSYLMALTEIAVEFFTSVAAVSISKHGAPKSHSGNQPSLWLTTFLPSFATERHYNISTFP